MRLLNCGREELTLGLLINGGSRRWREDLLGMRGVVELEGLVYDERGKLNKYFFGERRHRCYFFRHPIAAAQPPIKYSFYLPHIRPDAEPAGP